MPHEAGAADPLMAGADFDNVSVARRRFTPKAPVKLMVPKENHQSTNTAMLNSVLVKEQSYDQPTDSLPDLDNDRGPIERKSRSGADAEPQEVGAKQHGGGSGRT